MRIAQQLYEGVDLGGKEGPIGLITYMRTDSTNLSKDSIESVRNLIRGDCGEEYLPAKPNVFARAKRAQEAHEAIRPTDVAHRPELLRQQLSLRVKFLWQAPPRPPSPNSSMCLVSWTRPRM